MAPCYCLCVTLNRKSHFPMGCKNEWGVEGSYIYTLVESHNFSDIQD